MHMTHSTDTSCDRCMTIFFNHLGTFVNLCKRGFRENSQSLAAEEFGRDIVSDAVPGRAHLKAKPFCQASSGWLLCNQMFCNVWLEVMRPTNSTSRSDCFALKTRTTLLHASCSLTPEPSREGPTESLVCYRVKQST